MIAGVGLTVVLTVLRLVDRWVLGTACHRFGHTPEWGVDGVWCERCGVLLAVPPDVTWGRDS